MVTFFIPLTISKSVGNIFYHFRRLMMELILWCLAAILLKIIFLPLKSFLRLQLVSMAGLLRRKSRQKWQKGSTKFLIRKVNGQYFYYILTFWLWDIVCVLKIASQKDGIVKKNVMIKRIIPIRFVDFLFGEIAHLFLHGYF